MNQTIVSPCLIKVRNRWVKVYTEKQKKQKSWSEITRSIDELFDRSIEDYTILHKPHQVIITEPLKVYQQYHHNTRNKIMLWQDRNGTWYSTISPIDAKIERAMIEANAEKVWTEKERSGDALFDELFGG